MLFADDADLARLLDSDSPTDQALEATLEQSLPTELSYDLILKEKTSPVPECINNSSLFAALSIECHNIRLLALIKEKLSDGS